MMGGSNQNTTRGTYHSGFMVEVGRVGRELEVPDQVEYSKERSKRWNGDVGGGGD